MINLNMTKEEYIEILEKGLQVKSKTEHFNKRITSRIEQDVELERTLKEEGRNRTEDELIEKIYINSILDQVFSNSGRRDLTRDEDVLNSQLETVKAFFEKKAEIKNASPNKKKALMILLAESLGFRSINKLESIKDIRALYESAIESLNNHLSVTIKTIKDEEFLLRQNMEFESYMNRERFRLNQEKKVMDDFINGVCGEKSCQDTKPQDYKESYKGVTKVYSEMLDQEEEKLPKDMIFSKELILEIRREAVLKYRKQEIEDLKQKATAKTKTLQLESNKHFNSKI